MAATSSSQSQPMPADAITRLEFEGAVRRAVMNRSRTYNNSFALSIRWERDNTQASVDTQHFQAILSTLQLNQADVAVLSEHDNTPGWTLYDAIKYTFLHAKEAPGKSIVLIHYAGHGEVRGGDLHAVEGRPRRKTINLQMVIEFVVRGTMLDLDIDDTDTVFILDCCYSHIATRASSTTARTVEILSASDDSTPEALAPPQNSLTGKLRGEISRRKRDGHRFVELSEVMATIRENSPVVKPTHHIKLGESVCFPFTGVTPQVDPRTIPPSLRAVFSVRIAENMTREQVDRLITWIHGLPAGFAIELDGLYTTSSTLLIFSSSYGLYTHLARYPGIMYISDVTSPNCRKKFGQSSSSTDR